jgi:hypothetical protein
MQGIEGHEPPWHTPGGIHIVFIYVPALMLKLPRGELAGVPTNMYGTTFVNEDDEEIYDIVVLPEVHVPVAGGM